MTSTPGGEAAPTFQIEFRHEPDLLRAHVTGRTGSLESSLAYWTAIAAQAARSHPSMLLVVDETEGKPLETEQLQQFVAAMTGMGLEGVRIAFVEIDGTRIPRDEAVEIIAREQGYIARVFGNQSDAALWLRHGER